MSAGAATAIAAHKKRQQEQEEEERLTTYGTNDLEGWEFKIVRSATGAFGKREVVEKLRQEESQAGWEMVEKFDNNRIRFKRRVDRRSNDHLLPFDPYRTSYGMGEGKMALIVISLILLLVAGVLLITMLLKNQ